MKQKKEILEEGKLAPEMLRPLLSLTSREVEVEAAVGEDAAVVQGSERLVITADPITFTEENIGIYTVAVNCNDIVAMGGIPRYLTTTLLLPLGTTRAQLSDLFRDLSEASKRAGVFWVGGHTEVTSAVQRIVVSGHAVGFIEGTATTTDGARPGDSIVMTKWAGLEGTTIIARSYPERSRELLGEASFREVLNWLVEPGINIVKEGRILQGMHLSSAHDPTEGGIATGIQEITARSGVGAEIQLERMSLRRETRILCDEWKIDPLGLLSSGVFLFTAQEEEAVEACRRLEEAGIEACIIGKITNREGEALLSRNGIKEPLPVFPRDEFLRIE
jgi:hydrogenase maturation factor